MKRALVTGGSGFIGRHVVAALEGAAYKVTNVDLAESRFNDVRDYCRSRASSICYDLVVHLAAEVGGRRVMDWAPLDHSVNLEIDSAMFRWSARIRPGRVVYFSSSCAYPVALGDIADHRLREEDINLDYPMLPDKLYGWTKLLGEVLAGTVAAEGVPVTVVRPFSVYGPGMNEGFAVHGFAEQIRQRADPVEIWGNAEQVRDYIHVSDVAAAVVAIARKGVTGPVNLGTGRATSLRELAVMMASIAGYQPGVKVAEDMPAGVPWLVADPARLRGFCEPRVSLESGLAGFLGA